MTRSHILFAALVVAFLILRLVHLEADPPSVPNGQAGRELIVEAPAKAYEARKLALFGELSTSDADAYRFWSVQAPAYVFPLAGFMSLVGVGHAQVRLYGVLVGLVGYVLLLAMLYGRIRTLPLLLVGLLSSVHFYYLHYLRAGLLEPQLNTCLVIAVFLALLGRKDPRWLFGVPIAWSVAFLTKQTAIVFLPLVVLILVGGVASERDRYSRAQRGALVAVCAACALGLLVLVSDEAYARTVAWNYQHMFHARESFTGPEASPLSVVGRTLSRVFDPQHWKQAVLLVIPVCLPVVLVHIARSGWSLLRRRSIAPLSLLASVWFLLALGALFATEHARGRFSHILLPPAFLLFGLELDSWLSSTRGRAASKMLVVAVVVASLGIHGGWSYQWLVRPRYEVRDANREISSFLSSDHVVVGHRAPLLAFDSTADVFIVRPPFNDAEDRIGRFQATHLLLSKGERAERIIRRHFPEAFAGKRTLTTVPFGSSSFALYELHQPLR